MLLYTSFLDIWLIVADFHVYLVLLYILFSVHISIAVLAFHLSDALFFFVYAFMIHDSWYFWHVVYLNSCWFICTDLLIVAKIWNLHTIFPIVFTVQPLCCILVGMVKLPSTVSGIRPGYIKHWCCDYLPVNLNKHAQCTLE